MELTLPPKQYTSLEQRNIFDRNLLQSVMSLPGVQSAALGNGGMPYSNWRSSYSFEGQPASDDKKILVSLISSQYPQTLGIPLKRGREFTEAEVENGMHVALINESAARLWPSGEDPTGRHIQIDALTQPVPASVLKAAGITPDVMIVGVVGDTKNDGLGDAALPAVYLPYTLFGPPDRQLAVRTFGDPMAALNAVREKVRGLDKDLALGRPVTLDEVLGEETQQPRFTMALLTGFAALGLSLAAIGIYCVISYNVSQRVHEIGVRMALGAKRSDILKLILLMVAKVAALGLVIGLCGSIVLERIVRFQVFAKASFDVASLAMVVIVLASTALFAAWLPASRAGNLDPVTALRHEA
jgi:putative ABC transport system permease protein